MKTVKDGFGHNDDLGNVYCHFCEWTQACGPNMERIEFALRKHLTEAHKLPLLYRVENETGRRTDIPT